MNSICLVLFALCVSQVLTGISVTCPSGQSLVPVADYKPTSNGCGSTKWQALAGDVLLPYNDKFESCCDTHDVCFGTCGAPDLTGSFKDCNSDFKDCMDSKCKKIKNFFSEKVCKATATLVYKAVKEGGENPYEASQKKACKCQ